MDYFGAALNLGQSILNKMPDYPEKERKKYHALVRQYNNEKTKDYRNINDDLIMNLREDAKIHWQAISSHLDS